MKNQAIQTKAPLLTIQVIELYKKMIACNEHVISRQVLRCGTSVGANQAEAQAAGSKKDFVSKMLIAKKECRELMYWLKLIKESKIVDVNVDELLELSEEVSKLLYRIIQKSQENIKLEDHIKRNNK